VVFAEYKLIGLSEEEVCSLLSQNDLTGKYRFIYTCDPLSKNREKDRRIEKRVIRVQNKDGFLDILIGYFERSSCEH